MTDEPEIRCWHPNYFAVENVCGGESERCAEVCPGTTMNHRGDPPPPGTLYERLAKIAAAEGGQWFLRWPDRWQADPHWRCENDHVSSRYLRSEKRGMLCLECMGSLVLTFPEDVDGPLVEPELRPTAVVE